MGLLEDLNSGKYNLVLFVVVFFLIFHQYWDKKTEPMSNLDVTPQVKEAIKQVYMADVEAIRNLSEVAKKLQAGGLTIPGFLRTGPSQWDKYTIFGGKNREAAGGQAQVHATDGNLHLDSADGKTTYVNFYSKTPTIIQGNLDVNGAFNLLPRGVIVAWTGTTAPAGWALCNGQNGTPNLQGRFVLGWNPAGGKHPKVPGSDYNQLGGSGGNQIHQLSVGELAAHAHNFCANVNAYRKFDTADGNEPHHFGGEGCPNTANAGGNEPHNTMPPYWILAYIMKL